MKDNVCKGLNALAAECHRIAVEHGWWENPPSFGESIALCHSELSEALEEYRSKRPDAYIWRKAVGFSSQAPVMDTDMELWGPDDKPEGVAVEVADCLIRILDLAGAMGWDLETIVARKCAYNETRMYRHGNKAL